MWKALLVVFLLLLVVLHWRTREHLEAGGTILAPEGEESGGNKMYTREQQRANWMILPPHIREFLKARYMGGTGQSAASIETAAVANLSSLIAHFYHHMYRPSQTPITMDDIQGYTAGSRLNEPEYAEMLKFYFIDQAPPSPTGPPPDVLAAGVSLPQPVSTESPTTSTPQPVPSSLDVSGPSTITINIR